MSPPTFGLTLISDDDLDELADFLDDHSPLNLDGVLGVLHAVAVAPSLVPPSAWIPLVLPDGTDEKDARRALTLLLSLHNEVLDAVNHRHAIGPGPEDPDACESFAAGYAAAAALDPDWIGNADRWTFASCVAYLGERRDLIPPATLEKFDALGDVKDTMRRDLLTVVAETHDSFLKYRHDALSTHRHRPARVERVGRNEPCPCGSGKKYKHCHGQPA